MDGLEVRQFVYYKDDNVFVDEEGIAIFTISREINTSFLERFKANEKDIMFYGKNGEIIELFYVTDFIYF